jgi:hypothetical protein
MLSKRRVQVNGIFDEPESYSKIPSPHTVVLDEAVAIDDVRSKNLCLPSLLQRKLLHSGKRLANLVDGDFRESLNGVSRQLPLAIPHNQAE